MKQKVHRISKTKTTHTQLSTTLTGQSTVIEIKIK